MNRLLAGRPAAIVLVPATFFAFSVCALGAPLFALFSFVQPPSASSAAVASPSANAWVFIWILPFRSWCEMARRGLSSNSRATRLPLRQERCDDRRHDLGRRIDLVDVAVV